MLNQNLTLSLDKGLLMKIKLLAAKKESSISELIREQMRKMLHEASEYPLFKKRALKNLKRGLHLKGGPYYSKRDEIYRK